jgi:hypothetical protein
MNNTNKPFIGIPLTNEKYLLSINKINNNKKDISIFDIISDAILDFI